MAIKALYTTKATATGGRDGQAATADGSFSVKLATPREMGGGGGGPGNNPEQLFASGYAACFLSALKFVASTGGPKIPVDAKVTATVSIGPRTAGGFGLDVGLEISLPELSRERGKERIWEPNRHGDRQRSRNALRPYLPERSFEPSRRAEEECALLFEQAPGTCEHHIVSLALEERSPHAAFERIEAAPNRTGRARDITPAGSTENGSCRS